ncbi:RNA methyltransferase [Clostridia bacterium]|nr:RNA methyltransferase [Clostridia bacterium]
MRIIAGDCKGRKLFTPDGVRIRPTSDKVKGAVFSMIGAYVDEAVVLDLFAGTGNLGLEALSRGAKKCFFCDNSPDSIMLLRKNISVCRMAERSEIISGSFKKAIGGLSEKLDLIFLDPPYRENLYEECFDLIIRCGLLSEDGIVVAEHDADSPLPDDISGLTKIREKRYGSTGVTLLGATPGGDGSV